MNNYVDDIARRAHVRSQLAMYSGVKREQGDLVFVLCPLHGEKTPSGRFRLDKGAPGYFRCFGCGQERKWNEIAPLLGLEPFRTSKPEEMNAPKIYLPPTEEEETDDSTATFVRQKMRNVKKLPKGRTWRSISTKLLRKIGARLAEFYTPPDGDKEGYWTKPRLYLPCKINGELVGFIKARIKKHAEFPSYINASGPWSRTHGLFPFDYAISMMRELESKSIVLVEGQRDALRLLEMGIPAMCILGTQSWSQQKAQHLESAGVEQLILFMDGDCAGIKATKLIRTASRGMFESIVSLALWKMKGSPWLKYQDEPEPSKAAKEAGEELFDPGNCPEWILHKIKQKFFEQQE